MKRGMVNVECPSCHETLMVKSEWLGRQAKCRKCGETISLAIAGAKGSVAPSNTARASASNLVHKRWVLVSLAGVTLLAVISVILWTVAKARDSEREQGRVELVKATESAISEAHTRSESFEFGEAKRLLSSSRTHLRESRYANVMTFERLEQSLDEAVVAVSNAERNHRDLLRAGWTMYEGRFISKQERDGILDQLRQKANRWVKTRTTEVLRTLRGDNWLGLANIVKSIESHNCDEQIQRSHLARIRETTETRLNVYVLAIVRSVILNGEGYDGTLRERTASRWAEVYPDEDLNALITQRVDSISDEMTRLIKTSSGTPHWRPNSFRITNPIVFDDVHLLAPHNILGLMDWDLKSWIKKMEKVTDPDLREIANTLSEQVKQDIALWTADVVDDLYSRTRHLLSGYSGDTHQKKYERGTKYLAIAAKTVNRNTDRFLSWPVRRCLLNDEKIIEFQLAARGSGRSRAIERDRQVLRDKQRYEQRRLSGDSKAAEAARGACKTLLRSGRVRSAEVLNRYSLSISEIRRMGGIGGSVSGSVASQYRNMRNVPSGAENVLVHCRFVFTTQAGLTREHVGHIYVQYQRSKGMWVPISANIDGLSAVEFGP